MGLAYIIPVNAAENLYNVIGLTPGSAPPRPHPPGQPGVPTHPIYNPPYPDIGGPGDQPYPDHGLPGWQPRPDHGLPPFPSHPIVIPSPPNVPSHPIELPPTPPGGVLPPGSGLIVPMPPDMQEPPPPPGTPADHEPYVVWFGPGTVASVVWLPPTATTKPQPKR